MTCRRLTRKKRYKINAEAIRQGKNIRINPCDKCGSRDFSKGNNHCLACQRQRKKEAYKDNPEKVRKYQMDYKKSNPNKVMQARNKYYQNNVNAIRQGQKEYSKSNPNKIKAKNAVGYAVKTGNLPPISTLKCEDNPTHQAKHYHHESYLPEHWLDVIPLCASCHRIRHSNERAIEPNQKAATSQIATAQ